MSVSSPLPASETPSEKKPEKNKDADLRQRLLHISQRTFAKSGMACLQSVATAIAEELQADAVIIGRHAEQGIETLAMVQAQRGSRTLMPDFCYTVHNTPCQTVINEGYCLVRQHLLQRYPCADFIHGLVPQAYVGYRVFKSNGAVLGVINALFSAVPSERQIELANFLLQVYGLRVTVEFERIHEEEIARRSRYYADEGFNRSPQPMLVIDQTQRIMRSNRMFSELSGYFPAAVQEKNIRYLFPGTETRKLNHCFEQLFNHTATHLTIEVLLESREGELIDCLMNAYSLGDQKGAVRHVVVQLESTREKKAYLRQLHTLSQSVELSPVAVAITDQDAVIEYINPRFTELTGYSKADSMGKKPRLNASGETPQEVYDVMWSTILSGRQWQGDLLNRRKDGSVYWARTTIFPIIDEQDKICKFVSLQEDISEARTLSQKLHYEATHDQLTGLVNRREFHRRLEEAIATAQDGERSHALCFMDLDQFKILNDTGGHIAGDALLTLIGKNLRKRVRADDTAARLGGDEFALILSNCSVDKAREIAEQILQSISTLNFLWDDKVYKIGVSIGITGIDSNTRDAGELLRQVDTACYSAKDLGRNCIHVYRDDDPDLSRRRAATDWVPQLNTALEQQRFELYTHPIINVQEQSGKPAYEILIRLRDQAGALILPCEFLPSAERYGLAPALDRCVFDRLYSFLLENPSALAAAEHFSINLSGASISDQPLLEHIIATITQGLIPPHKFQFEITETAAISNIVEARHFMQKLRLIGCLLALDDFGCGLSSFAYLKNLPVDVLKIDGLFVRGMLENDTDYTMVKMINELAHSLGIQTIAEYIESEAAMNCTRQLGIDYAQGFHIARPQDIRTLVS